VGGEDPGVSQPRAPQNRWQRSADRAVERITRSPLRGAWRATAIVTVSVTLIGGVLMRLTDPDTFPNIWLGLWWSIQTLTTVGYGDVVPESVAGRVVATLVMIGGIGFITVTTAAIASAFVEAGRRRGAGRDPQLEELRALRQEVAALAAEVRALRGAGGRGDAGGP
jgi:voltage-gated potassium channel